MRPKFFIVYLSSKGASFLLVNMYSHCQDKHIWAHVPYVHFGGQSLKGDVAGGGQRWCSTCFKLLCPAKKLTRAYGRSAK